MNLKILVIALIGLIFIGCGTPQKINVDKKPVFQVPKKVVPAVKRKGALYSRRGASLFADKKDLQVGDIIQVLIEETLTNDSTGSKETTKANSSALGGGVIGPSSSSALNSRINDVNSVLNVGFSTTNNNSFKGSVKSSTDEEFTTTISAIIEQTYQNGNYFINGSKEMLINGEKQTIKISGVIRPYDISPENTVYSYQLANLKILYDKDGEDSNSLEKSWGTKVIEAISPF